MKIGDKFKEKGWKQYALAACIAVLLYVVLIKLNVILAWLKFVLGLLSPVIYGMVIAYLISPLSGFIERRLLHKINKYVVRHQLANVIAMITVVILFVLLMSVLIPQVIDSISMFIGNINSYAEALRGTLDYVIMEGEKYNLDMSILDSSTSTMLNDFVTMITNNVPKIAAGSISATNNAMNLGLGLILAVYFIVYKNTIINTYHRILSTLLDEQKYKTVTSFFSECNKIMTTYVVSNIIDGIIIGIANAIFMMVTGTPYLVLISVVVGVTNLLPTFGPFIGAFIGGLILLFASPHSVIPFLVFTLALQLCDGYVIKPKLFGGALGIAGVWITLGIIVGAKLFGFLGVLLAAPVVAIISFVLEGYLGKKKAGKDIYEYVPESGTVRAKKPQEETGAVKAKTPQEESCAENGENSEN